MDSSFNIESINEKLKSKEINEEKIYLLDMPKANFITHISYQKLTMVLL